MNVPAAVRAAAARVVAQVAHQGRSLDRVLAAAPEFDGSDRALLRVLSFGTVRWYLRLQALLARLSSRSPRKLEPEIEALLLVGLYQLLDTNVAPHAAVSETVEAARVLGRPRASGLVNAVLRRAQREADALLAAIDNDLALRTAHPAWLVERLRADWGDEIEALLDANNEPPPLWLRVNRRRLTVDECRERLAAEGHEVTTNPYAPDALQLAAAVDVRSLQAFVAGAVSVQDAAAQLAARLLAPQPGERLLDACAAPGGKTCHLLEIQPELAELVAVDDSADRLERVRENLDRLGLEATLVRGDASAPADWWDGGPFDRILLDVPCSATGVIRRHPDIKLLRRPHDIETLAARQRRLLERLWPLLRPGGRLVYASCSALRSENADVVEGFLAGTPLAIDATPRLLDFDQGRPGIAIRAGSAGMDGFYYACLEKANG
ncbi:MAG TPA: 16S rRNA (cytosine(967)-C(5))-methyltransferase RsmB [Steroidobacteraceae bacterium]|nr:16S rRNA (cytosine(967)-C(5))-methyltransferase RsmB [Steroidobacteraceae bacterium]